jgi:RNA polymerase sigma factor (sigma-70 family)
MIDELLRRASWTRRLARGLLGRDSEADDVVQEAWLSALRRPPDPSTPLEPWLRTVVRHHAANRVRQERRRQIREEKVPPPAAPGSPEERLEELETHRLLVDEVAALPEAHRQAVTLRYFEGLSSAQIAERLGIPAGTVRGRLRTALDELRRSLDRRAGGRGRWQAAVGCFVVAPAARPLGTALAVGAPVRHALGGVGRTSCSGFSGCSCRASRRRSPPAVFPRPARSEFRRPARPTPRRSCQASTAYTPGGSRGITPGPRRRCLLNEFDELF